MGDADENIEHLCWGTGSGAPDEKIGLVIGDDASTMNTSTKYEEEQEPLALLVVHAAMHMLFLPQFTCDFYEEADGTKMSAEEAVEAAKKRKEEKGKLKKTAKRKRKLD